MPETLDVDGFSDIFDRFSSRAIRKAPKEEEEKVMRQEPDSSSSEEEDYETKVASKKKQRKMNRISVALLKENAKRPDVVEWTDATAQDPFFLISLKSQRNTIPVPTHWSQRRKFLQGKRGSEKIPYELPGILISF